MSSSDLKYFKINEEAFDPIIGSNDAAGIDLKSSFDYILEPKTVTKIQTNLKLKFPKNTFGKIENRSSMALKNIDVKAGIIDRDYTGEIIVLLYNNNDYKVNILKGDKIAQIICYKYVQTGIKEIYSITETERNEKGFGSTGR